MPDAEKRIVIAVDAGEALQSLGKVKGSTDQLLKAKKEELKVSRAKAAFDKAEAASATAAQRAGKIRSRPKPTTGRRSTLIYRGSLLTASVAKSRQEIENHTWENMGKNYSCLATTNRTHNIAS